MGFVYFQNCVTIDELKREYRKLVMVHHPDRGGDEATMWAINTEYGKRMEWIKANPWSDETGAQDAKHDVDDGFMEVVNRIASLDGINVEICGTWLWATGNTREVKDYLKAAGFKWSSRKMAWYWHDGEYMRRGKRQYTMDEIRQMHGSERIYGRASQKLA
jgi:hypothetical protein